MAFFSSQCFRRLPDEWPEVRSKHVVFQHKPTVPLQAFLTSDVSFNLRMTSHIAETHSASVFGFSSSEVVYDTERGQPEAEWHLDPSRVSPRQGNSTKPLVFVVLCYHTYDTADPSRRIL